MSHVDSLLQALLLGVPLIDGPIYPAFAARPRQRVRRAGLERLDRVPAPVMPQRVERLSKRARRRRRGRGR